MQAPHIKILLTKTKLHVFFYVSIKYLKYYVVNFIAFTIESLTSGILYYRMQVGLRAYNHPPSCPVSLHVLIPGNLSVLSSTKIIYTLKYSLHYFTKLLQLTDVVCMDATLKNSCTISLCNLNTTYHFLGRRQTARYVNYSNSQFKSTPLFSYCS
jgi:hypothetical protein